MGLIVEPTCHSWTHLATGARLRKRNVGIHTFYSNALKSAKIGAGLLQFPGQWGVGPLAHNRSAETAAPPLHVSGGAQSHKH